MPDCAISTDIIAGFCGETEEEHQDTLSLMEAVQYDMSYMFQYSERPRTLAQRKYENDVPDEVKAVVCRKSLRCKRATGGSNQGAGRPDVPGAHRRHIEEAGRPVLRTNHVQHGCRLPEGDAQRGTYVNVHVHDCTAVTLLGTITDEPAVA